MGRMLDTLNQSESAPRERHVLAVAVPPIRVIADDETDEGDEPEVIALPVPPTANIIEDEPEPSEMDEDDEATPFIEVGGPRTQVEASPEVLAFPAAPPPPVVTDEETLIVGGTSQIWCSWTLRPGVKAAK